MSLLALQKEPTQGNPCWVLTYKNRKYGNVKLCLQEYRWAGESWRPEGEPEYPKSLYRALEKADWVGHLPKQGRARRAFTVANLKKAEDLYYGRHMVNPSQIAVELGISRAVAKRLVERIKPLS